MVAFGNDFTRFKNMPQSMRDSAYDYDEIVAEPDFISLKAAYAIPLRRIFSFQVPPQPGSIQYSGGICDRSGEPVPEGDCVRGSFNLNKADPVSQSMDSEYLKGTWLFGGILFRDYGHFLLESVSRLWPLASTRMSVIFLSTSSLAHLPFQLEALAMLGLRPEDIHVVSLPTIVEVLVVPQPTFVLHRSINQRFMSIIKRMKDSDLFMRAYEELSRKSKIEEKVYLSRTQFKDSREIGESIIEARLGDNGFRVIHPQDHSFASQAALISRCKIIAGIAGSHLHTSLFCETDAEIIHFCAKFHNTYRMIDRVAGHRSSFVYCKDKASLSSFPGNRGPWLINPKTALEAMKGLGFLQSFGEVAARDMDRLNVEYKLRWIKTALTYGNESGDLSLIDRTVASLAQQLPKD